MRGNFPQTCKHFNSPKNDIKSSLGYFHITWKYPRRKFPFISPEFPQGNYEEISPGMIPWNSPINLRGNLWDVDGSPAGKQCGPKTKSLPHLSSPQAKG